MRENIVIDMRQIDKVYPNGVVANSGVDFQVAEGEIHALMGENGAGKSTLMKILFGMEQPSKGEIYINGTRAVIATPMKAIQLGIGMVHQHFMLVPTLTVTENIVLGMEPKTKGLMDYKTARARVLEAAEKYHFRIDADARVKDLDVGKKQKVEILKALYRGAEILILDEPTAVLTPQETQELFEQLTALSKSGVTIIFISHKIKEVKTICQRISIMRNGVMAAVHDVAELTVEEISEAMVGRNTIMEIEKSPPNKQKPVLEVKKMCLKNEEGKAVIKDVSINIYRGHILGIAGVEGNGQREFVDCITGLLKADSGEIKLNGCEISKRSIKEIRDMGMAHIPEDRIKFGVALDESIEDNIISDRYDKKEYHKAFLLDKNKIRGLSNELIEKFRVKTDSPKTAIGMLSGGNMQKVVAAREMTSNPEILIADQPTRGIDVGAASFIHHQIIKLRDNGKAVLLVSADINEVMELSDSLAVFYEGEINGYFEDAGKVTEEELGLYMLGLKKMSREEIGEAAKS